MSLSRLLALVVLTFFAYAPLAVAQPTNLAQQDLSKIRVDQLSDAQIAQYLERAEAQGVTDQQIESQAIIRGMSRTEVSKLMSRIRRVRQTGGRTAGASGSRGGGMMAGQDTSQYSQRDAELDLISEEERKIFGFELFNTEELSFEPSLNLATPQNYQVGPGDELSVNIWGASRQNYPLEVNRDGTVTLDNLGPVYVNGFTIDEAEQTIINRLSEIYAGLRGSRERPANTFAEVTLGQVRSIKVNVVGEVRRPGTYTVSSLASPFNLLYLSGGPSRIGSFRNIEVERGGEVVATLDVYDYLVGGQKSRYVSLQDQDIIRVVPYDTRIELVGEVKRPGYYEMKKQESLREAIRFGGGFSDQAYTHRLKIARKTSRARRILDVAEDELGTVTPHNGDVVTIDSILDRFENRVEVLGAVFRPGEYALTEGLTVGALVKKAEGLREDAFTSRALVYRRGDDLSTTVQSVDLQGVLTGRAEDVLLQREDVLRVYSIFDLEEEFSVNIDGEVQAPGEFPYMRGMTLEDLVAMAGGVKESASRARVEVARRMNTTGADQEAEGERLETAETFQFRVDKNLTLGEADATFTLMPYDRVFVRRSPGYEEQQMVYVRGEVQYPGTYVLKNKNERISDLIARAGGLTSYAYQPGAQLIRLNPAFYEELVIKQEIVRDSLQALRYQQRLNRLNDREGQSSSSDRNGNTGSRRYESSYDYVEDDLLTEEIIVPKYKMDESETQRIGIELQSILSQPKSRYDLRLVDSDTLHVPRELETVKMTGQLLYPISSRYDQRKSFKNYIADAGGFSEDADRRKAYVVYANGSADRTRSFLFFKNYPEVRPGAEIVVPQKANRVRMSPQAWVGIGSGLASLAFTIVLIVNQLDQPRP
ncbi:MAG: SLBB domain-containing protein [Tunicatimonas sp.]